jgi:uncharacterized membrane protein
MASIEKTVFISYRRKDISWALDVYQYLTYHQYDVFFDYTSIPSGDFERNIIGNIKARAHFLVILTPEALERCNEAGDWLRREIETALDEKRNIVPIFFDGFSFGDPAITQKMTGKLSYLNLYNGLNIHSDYFIEGMERLSAQYLNVPLDAVLHPVLIEVQKIVKKEQLAANQAVIDKNLDYLVGQKTREGKEYGVNRPGERRVIKERIQPGALKTKYGIWSFGTHQLVYGAISLALYSVLAVATNFLQLPASSNVAFRPAVAIPLFFGIAFGPIVGFISGFLGNVIADLISGTGFWIWWDIGIGMMGLVAGLMAFSFVNFKARSTLLKAERYVILAVLVGMGVASISEMWVSGANIFVVINENFIPSVIANLINGLILIPILMIAYDAVVSRSGR